MSMMEEQYIKAYEDAARKHFYRYGAFLSYDGFVYRLKKELLGVEIGKRLKEINNARK